MSGARITAEHGGRLSTKPACAHHAANTESTIMKYLLFACMLILSGCGPKYDGKDFELGKAEMEQANYSKAIEHFMTGLEQDPGSGYAHSAIGTCNVKLSNFRKAKKHFNQALELGDTTPTTYEHLSLCLLKSGHRNEAIRFLTRGIKIHPDNVDLVFARAEAHHLVGNKESAKKDLQKTLELNPSHARANALITSY